MPCAWLVCEACEHEVGRECVCACVSTVHVICILSLDILFPQFLPQSFSSGLSDAAASALYQSAPTTPPLESPGRAKKLPLPRYCALQGSAMTTAQLFQLLLCRLQPSTGLTQAYALYALMHTLAGGAGCKGEPSMQVPFMVYVCMYACTHYV